MKMINPGAFFVLTLLSTLPAAAKTPAFQWRERHAIAIGSELTSVAYGRGMFLAVSRAPEVSISVDGVCWATYAGPDRMNAVIFVNDRFVAVGDEGRILSLGSYGPWQSRAAPGGRAMRGITYGNGMFVAVGDGQVMTAPNETDWDLHWLGADVKLNAVAWGNGRFVAVGSQTIGTNNYPLLCVSTNGIDWTRKWLGPAGELRGITFGNGVFLAVGSQPSLYGGIAIASADGDDLRQSGIYSPQNAAVYAAGLFVSVGGYSVYSTDGETWISDRFDEGYAATGLTGVSFGNGTFVGVGPAGTVYTSQDGQRWTKRSAISQTLRDVIYANGGFVTLGGRDVMTSPNARQWTAGPGIPGCGYGLGLAHRNGTYVMVGSCKIVLHSTNAVDWITDVSSIGANYLESVAWVPRVRKFVAVGVNSHRNGGKIATSGDGRTWLDVNHDGVGAWPQPLSEVAHGGGMIVAVGRNGSIATSPDAINWTARDSGTTQHLNTVAYGDGRFMAGGQDGVILISSDAISWTRGAATSVNNHSITYGDGVWVAVGEQTGEGRVHTSTDGLEWPGTPVTFSNALYAVTYGANSFVAVGEQGLIVQSGGGRPAVSIVQYGAGFGLPYFEINVSSTEGGAFRLQRSSNLQDWTDVATISCSEPSEKFVLFDNDSIYDRRLRRFYRAVMP